MPQSFGNTLQHVEWGQTHKPREKMSLTLETVKATCISENKPVILASLDSRCPCAIFYLLSSPTDKTEIEKKIKMRLRKTMSGENEVG